jgi:V/A-type H+-transporting ATPase subunit I
MIQSVDHWIAFILLGIIGVNMVREALNPEEAEGEANADFSPRAMLGLAVATSIDALAVGVTFAFLEVSIVPAVSLIGVTTFLCSAAAVWIGHRFGLLFRSKAELLGGLVLIGIGLLLKKVPSFKDLAPLVVTLGAGTVVVGFFLHSFFSIDIAEWPVFAPIRKVFLPAEIGGFAGGMVLSIIIGILHICLAMVVKAINAVKVKGWAASLGTLGWTLLIVGGVLVGGFALAGVLSQEVTKWIIIVLGIVSALGIFVFNDPARNKLANIGVGLWDTYNTATGLLGDVLSYLRLYALGLAGGMLGMAFNDMGRMVLGDGSNAVLWIPFLLLVILGHTLNIAMCALGAFVHPLRLNFLEFFKNSGYEAAGRNYHPLKKQ